MLMPLAATVLVFMACYLPLIEMPVGYAVDNKSYSFEKKSYSVGADIYDGSTPRNISIAVRAIGCLISLLFYTLLWSPWKLFSRTLLLGLLTVSQVILLINFILTSTDILSCPRNRCSNAIAIKCLFGAFGCTTFGVLVGGCMMPGLVQIWVKDFWGANEDWGSGTSRVVESTQDEESPAPPAQGKENQVAEPVIIHVKVPDR